MHVPLPSVTIDILGQNYRKDAKVKYQKQSHFTLIQSIWLKSIQFMLPKRFSFSKVFLHYHAHC